LQMQTYMEINLLRVEVYSNANANDCQ